MFLQSLPRNGASSLCLLYLRFRSEHRETLRVGQHTPTFDALKRWKCSTQAFMRASGSNGEGSSRRDKNVGKKNDLCLSQFLLQISRKQMVDSGFRQTQYFVLIDYWWNLREYIKNSQVEMSFFLWLYFCVPLASMVYFQMGETDW